MKRYFCGKNAEIKYKKSDKHKHANLDVFKKIPLLVSVGI